MKKVIITLSLTIIIILGIGILYSQLTPNTITIDNLNNNNITMLLETDVNSNNYEISNNTTWPDTNYTFNATLSYCDNGSEITWNATDKTITLKGDLSDKCYFYFSRL